VTPLDAFDEALSIVTNVTIFFAPGRRVTIPSTECFICSAPKSEHLGARLDCPRRDADA